jgi:hypothetical protein
MRRTSIYLDGNQSATLDHVAKMQGISRAELIRRVIAQSISDSGTADLEADLAAIRDSFGIARGEGTSFGRGPGARSRHTSG